MTISIIVPVYYGKKYIEPMIKQFELCAEQLNKKYDIELIFSNDAPGDCLEEIYASELITVVVLNTDMNRGIQGARVKGLEHSRGEYVLFLDQDDMIKPSYLRSQLEKIQECDAVVCRAIHEERPFYNSVIVFEEAITKKYMLEQGCGIVSPGQVLLKKEAVSEIWKTNLVSHNGADDWLLWLCMFGEGKSFALNQEILYEHVVHGANTAFHTERMLQSEYDVYEILQRAGIYSIAEINKFKMTIEKIKSNRLALMDKFKKLFFVYNTWIALENKGKTLSGFLKEQGCQKVAIYGYGHVGKQMVGRLRKENVEIAYLADRNAAYIEEDIPAYTIEDDWPETSAVIVTLVEKEEAIVQQIKRKMDVPIWTIRELLAEMEKL